MPQTIKHQVAVEFKVDDFMAESVPIYLGSVKSWPLRHRAVVDAMLSRTYLSPRLLARNLGPASSISTGSNLCRLGVSYAYVGVPI